MKNILKNIFCAVWVLIAYVAMAASLRATPIILNATESAAPGDVIYLQGDLFTSGAQVWMHVVQNTDTTLTPDTQLTVLSNTTLKTSAVTARLAKNIPFGLYAIWVKDSSGAYSTAPTFINQARVMQFEYDAVPAGYVLRLFGRNLCLPGATPNVSFVPVGGGTGYPATVVTTYANDTNVLQIKAPAGLPTSGTFSINAGNGFGHNSSLSVPFDVAASVQTIQGRASGTDSFALNVPWGADFSTIAANVINVVSSINPHTGAAYGADPGGTANSINAIQQAAYDAGNTHLFPNGATIYLPAGTFLINNSGESTTFTGTGGTSVTQPTDYELILPPNVVLEGAGVSQTTINDASIMPYPDRGIVTTSANNNLNGILNLTYTQTATVTVATPIIALAGTEQFISNVVFNFGYNTGPGNVTGGELDLTSVGGHDLLCQNVTSDHGHPSVSTGQNIGSYFNIRNNVFKHHGGSANTRIDIGESSRDVVFENNVCTLDGQWPPTQTIGTVYTGTATSGTPYTLVDSGASWTTNAFANNYVTITSGTGSNQEEQIASNTATTLTLKDYWTTLPDTTSVFTIGSSISFPWEQGQIECDAGSYETFLNNTFDAINTPLDYQDDYETFNSQGQTNNVKDTGTATSGTSDSITDSTANWVAGNLIGQVLSITGGPGANETGTVTANTSTAITVGTTWGTVPTSASTYSVTRATYDYGTVSIATSTTLSGSSASGVTSWPTKSPGLVGQTVAIVSGPGTGQWRTIVSNTSNSVTIATPWAETPTSSSTYSITGGEASAILFKENLLTDEIRGVALYTGSFDCAVVNNTFVDTGETVYLRSDQRPTVTGGGWYGRLNLTWHDVVSDNVAFDTNGTRAATIGGDFYDGATSPSGVIVLAPEFRRNIIYSNYANQQDNAIGAKEGYSCFTAQSGSFTEENMPGLLTSVISDNEDVNTVSSNTNYPIYFNTDTYLATILNEMNLGTFSLTPLPYSDAELPGAGHASVSTSNTSDPIFLTANISGTGTTTGGTSNMIDTGGSGILSAGSGVDSASIVSTSTFNSGSGDYLECTVGVGTGTTGHIQITPTTSRTSWGRIFDFRTGASAAVSGVEGEWLVNGAFDFFWRPLQVPSSGNDMRPIDINNGTNGVRIILSNTNASANALQFQVATAIGGGGPNITATYAPGFAANSIYHIGVTFSTNPTTGLTTLKMFCVAGTGSITTSSSTNLIGTTTFTLSPTVVTNTTGILSNGPWNFGDYYGNGSTATTNDYDGFSMYSQDPGTFPALP